MYGIFTAPGLFSSGGEFTAGGSFTQNAKGIRVSDISISIVGSDVVVEGTSNKDLSNGVWGFAYSIGVGEPLVFWVDVSGVASSQTITVPLADLGAVSGDTINVQAGYSLENPAGTIVYVGTETAIVYGSYIGLEASANYLLMETGDILVMESGLNTDISAMTAAAALDGTEEWAIVQGGVTLKATTNQLRTYING